MLHKFPPLLKKIKNSEIKNFADFSVSINGFPKLFIQFCRVCIHFLHHSTSMTLFSSKLFTPLLTPLLSLWNTGYTMQDTGYRIQDTGYRIQDTEYRVQDTGYNLFYSIMVMNKV